jgi:hypothetical protein
VDRAHVTGWTDAFREAWISNEPAPVAVVHWNVFTQNVGDPIRVEYDGVIHLRFAPDGRCREHREWFFRRERK